MKNEQLLQVAYKSFELTEGNTVIAADLVEGAAVKPNDPGDRLIWGDAIAPAPDAAVSSSPARPPCR